jgi:hypothetical protein
MHKNIWQENFKESYHGVCGNIALKWSLKK